MNKFLFITLVLVNFGLGQNKSHIYDLSDSHYIHTNFNKIDSLEAWDFEISYNPKNELDSIKPKASIIFWRKIPIKNRISKDQFITNWQPKIEFEIFDKSALTHCVNISKTTRRLSSCVAPFTGGDIFLIANYVFINKNVCLTCIENEKLTDYCRPIVNSLMSNLDLKEDSSLSHIEKEIRKKISIDLN